MYAGLGFVDEALDLIEQNVDVGWGSLPWIESDPDLDPLRDHPRFAAILRKLTERPEAT